MRKNESNFVFAYSFHILDWLHNPYGVFEGGMMLTENNGEYWEFRKDRGFGSLPFPLSKSYVAWIITEHYEIVYSRRWAND